MPIETLPSIPTSLCAPMDLEPAGFDLGHEETGRRSFAPQEVMLISPDAFKLQVVVQCVEDYLHRWRESFVFRQATYSASGQRQLSDKLHAAFEAEPFEDGMNHPAEHVISETLGSENEHDVLHWLQAICLEPTRPAFAAGVFLCVARQSRIGTPQWRTELVRRGLEVDDVEVRDTAAQAGELWGDPGVRDVLEAHLEPVAWLRDYIRDVVDYLER